MSLNRLVAAVVGWTAGVFYRTEVTGEKLPDGPVLVTANHPNSLLDPLLIFRSAGRPTRPLAKAPLFEQAFVGPMLKALGGLPVYRKQDDPALMHLNDETFRKANEALQAGDAVVIFPEGISHSEPSLAPIRTGAARLALTTEAQKDWKVGLRIVPVGLTYQRKSLFRGHALVTIGKPYTIGHLRAGYEANAQEAVRELTDRITTELQGVTLNFAESEDQDLIDVAERLYAREKGLARPREREPMAERMPRLRRFAEGLAWLRANDPARHAELASAVRAYARRAKLLGATDGDVPARYAPGGVLRYALGELDLMLGIPLAAAGTMLWYPAYILPRLVLRFVKPPFEAIATYKLAGAMFAFPLLLAGYIVAGFLLGGVVAAIGVALIFPLLGFIALAWRERWQRIREDARLFVGVLRHPRSTHRLAELRRTLVEEFDGVLRRIEGPLATS